MARSLRKSTRKQTIASAKTAKEAGFVRRPLKRNQRYKSNKGLVSIKIPKKLESITAANAANSPLLRLPREIRHEIFFYAMRVENDYIGLYYKRYGKISWQESAIRAGRDDLKDLGVHLPRVSRQIYSETATMVYSENCFAFRYETSIFKWLSKRLPAQLEAIRWIMLPSSAFSFKAGRSRRSPSLDLERTAREVREMCPNLVCMEENSWL